MWDVRSITTILEYANCLWLQTVQTSADGSGQGVTASATRGAQRDDDDGAASGTEVARSSEAGGDDGRAGEAAAADSRRLGRAWVALGVLPHRPFYFTWANVVKFYTALLDNLSSWLRDLQDMLPVDITRRRPVLGEDDVYVHLSEVVLAVLDRWVSQVSTSRADESTVDEFANGWTSAEGVLARLRGRLGDVEGETLRATARRLLKELRRLETLGRRIAARSTPQPGAAPPLPVLPTPVPALPELA